MKKQLKKQNVRDDRPDWKDGWAFNVPSTIQRVVIG